jgi:hypothetical protein
LPKYSCTQPGLMPTSQKIIIHIIDTPSEPRYIRASLL